MGEKLELVAVCCNECDYVQTTGTITLFLTLHVPMAIFTDQSRLPYTLKCAAFSLHTFSAFLDARWRCIIELCLSKEVCAQKRVNSLPMRFVHIRGHIFVAECR